MSEARIVPFLVSELRLPPDEQELLGRERPLLQGEAGPHVEVHEGGWCVHGSALPARPERLVVALR